MSKYNKQVVFNATEEAVETAKGKLEHGELSERLRETIRTIAYGAETTERERLREKLKDLREDGREIDQQIRELRVDREEINRDIERVETRLEQLQEDDGKYDGVLEMLETDLSDGVRITSGSPRVQRAAEIGNCEPTQVIDDLKDRNPEIPDKAFRTAHAGEDADWRDTRTNAFAEMDK